MYISFVDLELIRLLQQNIKFTAFRKTRRISHSGTKKAKTEHQKTINKLHQKTKEALMFDQIVTPVKNKPKFIS